MENSYSVILAVIAVGFWVMGFLTGVFICAGLAHWRAVRRAR